MAWAKHQDFQPESLTDLYETSFVTLLVNTCQEAYVTRTDEIMDISVHLGVLALSLLLSSPFNAIVYVHSPQKRGHLNKRK